MNKSSKHTFTDPVYTIGIAARMVGLSVHALRLYEAEGLIITHKTDTGRRLFSDLELEKIECIHSMVQEEGLNFEGIRRLMALVPCWKIRSDCSGKKRKSCDAYKNKTKPCWSTKEKCGHPMQSCRDCTVYQNLVHCEDIQKYMKP
ncbi:MerR family transcriptional regulator [Spirochaetota bacterium]